jgi:hypothetical protein
MGYTFTVANGSYMKPNALNNRAVMLLVYFKYFRYELTEKKVYLMQLTCRFRLDFDTKVAPHWSQIRSGSLAALSLTSTWPLVRFLFSLGQIL